MRNFKYIFYITSLLFISACFEFSNEHFFNSTHINPKSKQIEYNSIHHLNLSIVSIRNVIDDSGFTPILKSHFQLHNKNSTLWAQAWVAFNIHIFIKGKQLASITKADVMQNHKLKVEFEQLLPQFGITKDDLTIKVIPIAWMPTFPLSISQKSNTSSFPPSYSEDTNILESQKKP